MTLLLEYRMEIDLQSSTRVCIRVYFHILFILYDLIFRMLEFRRTSWAGLHCNLLAMPSI